MATDFGPSPRGRTGPLYSDINYKAAAPWRPPGGAAGPIRGWGGAAEGMPGQDIIVNTLKERDLRT